MKFKQLILAASLAVLPALAFAVGAIAVDDEVGDDDPGYGFSTGHDSQKEAEKAALSQCRKSGNKNCRIAVWFKGCGAYAASKKYYGIGWGSSQKTAESKAMDQCGKKSCEIVVSECDD